MKKIIDNVTYDTESAKLAAKWDNVDKVGFGLDSMFEELYMTEDGHWFVYGEGGARTEYAKPREIIGGFTPSSDIIPLENTINAFEWAEKRGIEEIDIPKGCRLFDEMFPTIREIK